MTASENIAELEAMMNRRNWVLGAGALTLLTVTGCARLPVVAARSTYLSSYELQKCILSAAAKRGWNVVTTRPGYMRLRYVKAGVHTLNVDVHYDDRGFKITPVKDGTTLYDEYGNVHRKVNQWTRILADDISAEANRRSLNAQERSI